MNSTIANAQLYIKNIFKNDYSGHDYSHTMRVYRTACKIAEEEYADFTTVGLAALLHDVDDIKLSPETCKNKDKAVSFMRSECIDEATISNVVKIIGEISFAGKDSVVPSTIEGKCVQDADRLDAIGAVGIARAFAYGGNHNRIMYDPDIPPVLNMSAEEYHNHVSTTLNHFYEKLFLLENMLNTDSAKKIAKHRQSYMQEFVDEFLDEWNGKC